MHAHLQQIYYKFTLSLPQIWNKFGTNLEWVCAALLFEHFTIVVNTHLSGIVSTFIYLRRFLIDIINEIPEMYGNYGMDIDISNFDINLIQI